MNKVSGFLKNKKAITELLRYLIIGVLTTIVDWSVSAVLKEFTILGETKAGDTVITVIAWVVSTLLFAFWMYKLVVFRSRSMRKEVLWPEFVSFNGTRLLALGIQSLVVLIFSDAMGFNYYVVKLCASILNIVLNYIFSKLIIFRKNRMTTLDEIERDEGGYQD